MTAFWFKKYCASNNLEVRRCVLENCLGRVKSGSASEDENTDVEDGHEPSEYNCFLTCE